MPPSAPGRRADPADEDVGATRLRPADSVWVRGTSGALAESSGGKINWGFGKICAASFAGHVNYFAAVNL